MANNLSSNTVEKLARIFTEKAESSKVLTNTVNKQLLTPRLTPTSGGTVSFKRPTDFNAIETAGGDISSSTKSDIITGKATGVVQNYITVATEWSNVEEALELDQLDELLAPMAARAITQLELNLGAFMIKNSGLTYGSPGTAVDAWSDVAGTNAYLQSIGCPMDGNQYYIMNPFSTTNLADTQSGLASGDNSLVSTAWTKAQINKNFGGMQAITSNALKSYTSGSSTDRVGALSATPDGTYVTAKDTMTQSLAVSGFTASATIKAGEIVTVTGRNRLNLSTREVIFDGTGSNILWTGTVTEDVTLSGAGAGTIIVTGPAINEANGQYNTVDSALTSGDIVTLSGTANTVYQPSLFFHESAFGLGTVKLPKLYSTDVVTKSQDGFSVRVCRYADGDSNTQKVRFDILPAFIAFNPFFAGQGFGVA